MALPLLAAGALPIARLLTDRPQAGEWTYLAFLGCYGLVFPAYVLIAMAARQPLRSKWAWLLLAIIILIGVPFYARGFLFNQTPWLAPPLIALVLWWLVRRGMNMNQALNTPA
jgi:hypothetical protein